MQREDSDGIIISCDFCGMDWDPYDQTNPRPMTEGHRGSVICLLCVQVALDAGAATHDGDKFECTMCRKRLEASDVAHWRPAEPSTLPGGNSDAAICESCIEQAVTVFSKDADVDWAG